MSRPIISVIVPLYNQGQYLDECLESLANQSFKDFEVIIIDDCSTDNSYSAAESLLEKYPKAKLMKNKRNMGVSYTRNAGVLKASGEFLVMLDADDKLDENYLLEVYSNRNKADIIYTDTIRFGTEDRIHRRPDYDLEKLKKSNLFNVTCLFRRVHFLEVGGFDEKIANLEDWEFFIRMGKFGHYGYRIPKALFYYRQKESGRFKDSRPIRDELVKYINKKLKLDEMAEPIDVVYILGTGSKWRNKELRYSLRSIEKHLKNYRNVYIIGYKPSWLRNVIHIPAEDIFDYNREANICHKVKIACETSSISENFLFMNDDHFFLKALTATELTPYTRRYRDLAPKPEWKLDKYLTCELNTHQALTEMGLTTYSYDIHTPIIYNKKNFLEAISHFDWCQNGIGLVVKSMYGNYNKLGAHPYDDLKINRRQSYIETMRQLDGRFVWSIGDNGICLDLFKVWGELYPEKSRYEE